MQVILNGRGVVLVTTKELRNKRGDIIPIGTKLTVMPHEMSSSRALVSIEGSDKPLPIGYDTLCKVTNLEEPSGDQLISWMVDSVCESVMGERVESDGFDSAGWPSWLMALGIC